MSDTETTQNNSEETQIKRLLRKLRKDSNLNGLTFEQCETVERWLFEENLGYIETVERVKKEFGVETSRWSMGRFYRQRARMRQSLELVEAQVTSDELRAMPARTEDLRAATMKLLAKSAVRMATEKPNDLEALMPLARLLVEGELNEIRLRRVKLEERYFDFKANTLCAKEMEKVRAYLTAVGDNENLTAAEKQRRVVELLFGTEKVNVLEAEEAVSAEEAAGDELIEEKSGDTGKGGQNGENSQTA